MKFRIFAQHYLLAYLFRYLFAQQKQSQNKTATIISFISADCQWNCLFLIYFSCTESLEHTHTHTTALKKLLETKMYMHLKIWWLGNIHEYINTVPFHHSCLLPQTGWWMTMSPTWLPVPSRKHCKLPDSVHPVNTVIPCTVNIKHNLTVGDLSPLLKHRYKVNFNCKRVLRIYNN